MAKKTMIMILVFSGVIIFAPRSYDSISANKSPMSAGSISASELCDVEGYTIIACTYTKRNDSEEESSEDIVKLDNGMIFRISGYLYYLSSGRAVVFARKFAYESNKEITSYKLFIDDKDRIYSASRIR